MGGPWLPQGGVGSTEIKPLHPPPSAAAEVQGGQMASTAGTLQQPGSVIGHRGSVGVQGKEGMRSRPGTTGRRSRTGAVGKCSITQRAATYREFPPPQVAPNFSLPKGKQSAMQLNLTTTGAVCQENGQRAKQELETKHLVHEKQWGTMYERIH